ncbi:MAG TPA: hypothetical protein VME46_13240 [Acidimicrobiales bacterium]|nr:hypothetical protein [Acidimicrobiales bacterium]
MDDDDPFSAGVTVVLKEVGEYQPAAGFDHVGKELAPEAGTLGKTAG